MIELFPILMAPLQGYTDQAYRLAHKTVCGGIAQYYTPFLRLEQGQIRAKDLRDLDSTAIPQIIAKNSTEFLLLIRKIADLGYREIDLNMGCPFPKQVHASRGSGLLANFNEVQNILKEINYLSLNEQLIFTIKMRLGQTTPNEGLKLLPLINDSAVKQVVLHPRLGLQQYKGQVDLAGFKAFYENCQKPLIYNGDITDTGFLDQLRTEFPRLAGVMIGRGLLARPTLASEYQQGITLTNAAVKKQVLTLHAIVYQAQAEKLGSQPAQLLQKMVTFWEYPEPLFGHKFVKKIKKARNLTEYQIYINECADSEI